MLTVYTDGACKSERRPAAMNGNSRFPGQVASPGNEKTGKGGWAWWVHDQLWDAGAVPDTTNNRMEILAVVQGLRTMKTHHPDQDLLIVSDSAYVVNAFHDDWRTTWENNGWKNSSNKPVKNRDLWEVLFDLFDTHPTQITLRHCRGHGKGGPMDAPHVAGNAKADKLAVHARLTLEHGQPKQVRPTRVKPKKGMNQHIYTGGHAKGKITPVSGPEPGEGRCFP